MRIARLRSDLTTIMLSCKKYQHCWDIFERCYYDSGLSAYSLTIVSDFNPGYTGRSEILATGISDWSTSLLAALESIDTTYICILLDDLWITEPKKVELDLADLVDYLRRTNGNYVNFRETPPLWGATECAEPFQKIPRWAPYRVNVCGVWRVSVLKDLLIPNESPWDFEIMGSYRSSKFDGFYVYTLSPVSFLNGIEKGRLTKSGLEFVKRVTGESRLGGFLPPRARDTISSNLKSIYFNLVCNVPWRFRVSLTNYIRRFLVSY